MIYVSKEGRTEGGLGDKYSFACSCESWWVWDPR